MQETLSTLKMDFEIIVFQIPLALVLLFLFSLSLVILQTPSMFVKKHGKYHALFGCYYLLWISYGFLQLFSQYSLSADSNHSHSLPPTTFSHFYLIYDVVLGILGIVLTLLAAKEFQHKNIQNIGSGTLDEHATVTYSEMIEHSFYQLLNLIQIIFLHLIVLLYKLSLQNHPLPRSPQTSWPSPYSYLHILLLIFVTYLWNIRHLFPINQFSDNYNQIDPQSTDFIRFLYRLKKYQYIFYKHFLLHGLNLTVVWNYHQLLFPRSSSLFGAVKEHDVSLLGIVESKEFHLYWLCLNTSYVMEFFLQTLVKKHYLTQKIMLLFQQILMAAATIVAINVVRYVSLPLAILSLIFNFIHRKQDFLNILIIFVGWTVVNTLSFPKN